MFIMRLEKLAKENNLTFVGHTSYHCKLIGLYSVNIYPTTSSYYINGMNGKGSYEGKGLPFLISVAKGETEEVNSLAGRDDRKKISRETRKSLWEKSPYCFWCQEKILVFEECSTEHKIPLSKGGSNRRDNLAVSHKECNKIRGDKIGVKKNEQSNLQVSS